MIMIKAMEPLAVMGMVAASIPLIERRPGTQKKTKNKDAKRRNKRNKAAKVARKRNR